MADGKVEYYIGTWLLVVVGWILVNQQNNRREERKEIRSSLLEIYNLIYEVVESSVKYHCAEQHDPAASKGIRLQLQRLALKISHLHFYSDSANKSVYEFRNAITLNNFDTKRFQRQIEESEIVMSIYSCGDTLIDNLELCFGKLFRQGFKIAVAEELRKFRKMVQV